MRGDVFPREYNAATYSREESRAAHVLVDSGGHGADCYHLCALSSRHRWVPLYRIPPVGGTVADECARTLQTGGKNSCWYCGSFHR